MQDPLEPFVIFWKRYVISGMGLFTEGYVLFSITNIHTLFQQSYKPCWKTYVPVHAFLALPQLDNLNAAS